MIRLRKGAHLTRPDTPRREWHGLCDCGTSSLTIMATFDLDGNIEMYELDANCSWCNAPWRIPVPPKEYV